MKSRAWSGSVGITAISCVSAAIVGGAPAAFADPSTPSDALCTMTYPTPDDFSVRASSEASAVSDHGSFDLTLRTDSQSQTGYEQKFSVTWANLDTGRSGQSDVTARVQGHDNVLSIPDVKTEPGRIALVLKTFNHGTGQNYTNGECSAEYVVR
ncbi:hypothetical protein [Nocardia sp. NPDC005998]|uniref:hypothetical protein n=1 Tax=Nocardia sp. NPDC005998 TaxID=3156894 RepID=UPI0033A2FAFD